MELDANTQEKIRLINERDSFRDQVKKLQEEIKKKNETIQKLVDVLKIYGDSNLWDDSYDEYSDTVDKKKIFNYSNEYGYLPAQEVLYNYLVKQEV
jgi:hypothetical protein